jgi:murE/murF fusion protein
MKLSELVKSCPGMVLDCLPTDAVLAQDIHDLTSDSRQIQKGSLFVAVKGMVSDGHAYINQAVKNGAVAVVAQKGCLPAALDSDTPVILVENSRACMGPLAARFYGFPSNDLILIGITGTNGKTTTTWLIEHILKKAGHFPGVIGTINIRYADQHIENPMTTPDAIELQRILSQMRKANITHVIIEVSSHGLDLNRVDGCCFDVGIFTNLTRDHLDYHADMDDYFDAKKQLFTRFLSPDCPEIHRPDHGTAVLNIDDPKGQELYQTLTYPRLSVSTRQPADVQAINMTDTLNGLSGTIQFKQTSFNFCSALTGIFNLENILCAAAAAMALGIPPEIITKGIESCHAIPGRLEKIATTIDRHLFVDYAHTPVALESILSVLRERTPKRLITVFGCGGDRDTTKRPLMGEIAARLSDLIIVTSDNPRTENPDTIITDILSGMKDTEQLNDIDFTTSPFKKGFIVEPDRKKAIEKAVALSMPQDTVIAAGKGHETYQITRSGTIHFDDAEQLKKATLAIEKAFTPMAWTINDLKAALTLDPIVHQISPDYQFSTIATDSRNIKPDQLFLALKGDNFDGHDFIPSLIEKGINGFIVKHGFFQAFEQRHVASAAKNALLIFEVADPLIALGQLARYQRLRSNVKLVAITGSSGKTTTRKLTWNIFSSRYPTLATKGNYNNEIGVPLTLLNLSACHEWAIVEMGMNHAGEISRLSQMAQPDIAIITNTATVHLEGLKTVENVAKAKAEIFDGMQPGSTAILFSDDQQKNILLKKAQANTQLNHILFFGSDSGDCYAQDIKHARNQITFTACFDGKCCPVVINSPARFMINNALAAIAAAHAAGIDTACMEKGLAAFKPATGRMNIYPLNDTVQLIDDAYNANPSSVSQALETLVQISQGMISIAILGDMLELGETSDQLHYQIGQLVGDLGIDYLFLFGTQVAHIQKGALANGHPPDRIVLTDKQNIIKKVSRLLGPETWILVKGSRGMKMETIISGLANRIRQKRRDNERPAC